MADQYVHLIGAERVEHAGRNMAGAAEQLNQVVDRFQWALTQHQQFMDEWLSRLETAIGKLNPAAPMLAAREEGSR